MNVRWTTDAKRDRADTIKYIALDDSYAAARLDELFSHSAARLAEFPHFGRIGKISGTRELIPHESYRLVYELDGETIWILALVHTARRWPPVD